MELKPMRNFKILKYENFAKYILQYENFFKEYKKQKAE